MLNNLVHLEVLTEVILQCGSDHELLIAKFRLKLKKVFLIAQLVKNLPAMQETLVRFLGWEDPLEKGQATHSSIVAWRIPWTV